MAETWIGVTGLYATDNPHPGVAVMRALRRADPSWRIVALTWDPWGTGAYADDLVDAHALIPYPHAGAGALLARLRALRARHALDVVIPTVDAEQAHWITLRATLRRLGVHTWLPGLAALRAREKRRLPALGRRAGIGVPPTVVLSSAEAVARLAETCTYPQVLKGALVDSVVVHTAEELRVAARELAADWGYPLLTQPLIAGEEYDVAGVARRGELLAAATMKKLAVTSKGTAWAGATVEDERFVALLRRLVRTLGWSGPIEAEFLATAEGEILCFEVNPRFPSWIALASDSGANLPAMVVELALGQAPAPVSARAGRLFVRAFVERTYAVNPLLALPERGVRPQLPGAAPRPAGSSPARGAGVVAVTGLNAGDNPSPGLGVARSLRALATRPRLVGFTHEVLATGGYVDNVWDEVRLLPFPSREDGGYPEALLAHCHEAGVDCLVPTLDIEVPLVAWMAARLAEAGVATLVPTLASLGAAVKSRLPALSERGFRVPRTRVVGDLDALADVTREIALPFVLKGPLADAKPVRTQEEARVVARRLAASWGFPLLAQEYIAGQEFGVAAVADRRHRVVGTVVVRKDIRSRNGNTWGGTAVVDRTLASLAGRFAEALDWVGPFELEVIRHPRRGPFLIEVNPRFPAWIYLAAGAGANLPAAAVALARGETAAPMRPHAGTFYARIAWDVTAPVERMGDLAVDGRVDGGHVA